MTASLDPSRRWIGTQTRLLPRRIAALRSQARLLRRHPGNVGHRIAQIAVAVRFELAALAGRPAVEPAADMVAELRANLALNGITAVEVHHAAVLDRPGRGTLYGPDPNRRRIGSDATRAASALTMDAAGDGELDVAVSTLDAIVVGRLVHGLKIDVEGYERLVLDGAAATLADPALTLIQLEWNSTSMAALGEDRHAVGAGLLDAGFVLGQVTPAGFITVASRSIPDIGGDVFAARGAAVDVLSRFTER